MFAFNNKQLRHVMIDGAPWFAAVDACRILNLPVGGAAGGASRHLYKLDAAERRVVNRGNQIALPLFTGASANAPSVTVISESGLYKLIMRSDKPEAKAFQNWVTQEVLPALPQTRLGVRTRHLPS